MIELNPDVVPLLPLKDVICGECVAIGTVEDGILIHYMDRDKALVIEWEDIVKYGISHLDTSHKSDEISDTAKEIDAPTKL